MFRYSKRRMLILAGCAALLAPGAGAQSVTLNDSLISIKNGAGHQTLAANASGDIVAGLGGTCGTITLADIDSTVGMIADGCGGDLLLGGGTDDGDVFLRDTDGLTTTVAMDGQLGLIELGSPNDDGDLWVWNHNTDDQRAIDLNGATGTASQQLSGNGFVKAWAKINANGTVAMCYMCDISSNETKQILTGQYEVSFSPLAPDIRARPRLAVLDSHDQISYPGMVNLADRIGDNDSVFVGTKNSSGDFADRPFTVFIF